MFLVLFVISIIKEGFFWFIFWYCNVKYIVILFNLNILLKCEIGKNFNFVIIYLCVCLYLLFNVWNKIKVYVYF